MSDPLTKPGTNATYSIDDMIREARRVWAEIDSKKNPLLGSHDDDWWWRRAEETMREICRGAVAAAKKEAGNG